MNTMYLGHILTQQHFYRCYFCFIFLLQIFWDKVLMLLKLTSNIQCIWWPSIPDPLASNLFRALNIDMQQHLTGLCYAKNGTWSFLYDRQTFYPLSLSPSNRGSMGKSWFSSMLPMFYTSWWERFLGLHFWVSVPFIGKCDSYLQKAPFWSPTEWLPFPALLAIWNHSDFYPGGLTTWQAATVSRSLSLAWDFPWLGGEQNWLAVAQPGTNPSRNAQVIFLSWSARMSLDDVWLAPQPFRKRCLAQTLSDKKGLMSFWWGDIQ